MADSKTILAFLEDLGVRYTLTAHEAAHTMEDLVPIEAELGAPFFRNLFLTNRQKTDFYLLLIGGRKPFRTAVVSKLLGVARLSFGDAEALMDRLGLVPGAVNPLSLLNDPEGRVRLVIDSALLREPMLCMHPGDNSQSLVMAGADLFQKVIPALGHEPTIIEIPTETAQ